MEESTSNEAEPAESDPIKPSKTEETKPKAKKKAYKKSGSGNNNNNTRQTTPVSTHRGMATGIEEHTFITGPNMGKQWITSREHLLAWATSKYGNNV